MKQLSGLDATFLHLETAEMPMHVGALNLYELPLGHQGSFLTQLRQHMAERLPLAPVLRRRLWWMPLSQKAALVTERQLGQVERANMHRHLSGLDVEKGGVKA